MKKMSICHFKYLLTVCTLLSTIVYYRVLFHSMPIRVHTPLYIGGVHSGRSGIKTCVDA